MRLRVLLAAATTAMTAFCACARQAPETHCRQISNGYWRDYLAARDGFMQLAARASANGERYRACVLYRQLDLFVNYAASTFERCQERADALYEFSGELGQLVDGMKCPLASQDESVADPDSSPWVSVVPDD